MLKLQIEKKNDVKQQCYPTLGLMKYPIRWCSHIRYISNLNKTNYCDKCTVKLCYREVIGTKGFTSLYP